MACLMLQAMQPWLADPMIAFFTKHRPGYGPAIGWFFLSTVLLCLPGSQFPKYNWFSQVQFDKWVHIGLFSMLVLLICWGFWSHKKEEAPLLKPFILIASSAILYGIGMEYVQDGWIPNRSFDLGDIWADAAGSLVGVWFSHRQFIKKPL